MSQMLEVALLIFASWGIAMAALFVILRWLVMRQHTERADLLDRCMEMIGTIHTYQVQAHTVAPGPDTGRHHYNEEQEDVLAREGTMTREQMAELLAEAEFLGQEIELES